MVMPFVQFIYVFEEFRNFLPQLMLYLIYLAQRPS